MSIVQQREVGDVSLEVRELGEGPPLLFLHGEDGLIFSSPVLDGLSASFRVIAPHHPGWGASTRPPHVTEARDIAMVYAELIEGLSSPPLLLGCSFGGWVAAELASLVPNAIAGLVLVSPTGVKLGGREDRDFADIWMASFEELPAIFYADPRAVPNLRERAEEDYLYLARAQEATARYCWSPYMHDPKLAPWLRRISMPALVIHGLADRFVLLDDYYGHYAQLIGDGARLVPLEELGHRVEEEAPDRVVDLVEKFAAEIGDAGLSATKGAH